MSKHEPENRAQTFQTREKQVRLGSSEEVSVAESGRGEGTQGEAGLGVLF